MVYEIAYHKEFIMTVAKLLSNMVPISTLNHGGASKTLEQVSDGNPVVVLKNNQPAAVIITPSDYTRLTEAEEDFALYQEAMERLQHDNGHRLTREEVFGKDYKPVDDGYEPEFE